MGVIGIFAGGAAIFGLRVEHDLERRVIVEFNDAEVGPVTASFNGQDGTLVCAEGPVDIPADLLERSRDLWGVVSLDVDASCLTDESMNDGVTDGVDSGDDAPVSAPTDAPTSTQPATTEAADAGEPTAVSESDADTVAGLVAGGSQFSTLQGLLTDTGLDATLAGTGPFTLFAPTNEAFQALGPDAIAALGRDPDLLAAVLSHHITAGAFTGADLRNGDVEMLDESSVTIDVTNGATITSGDAVASVVEPDLLADNGVVHVIDQVLVPAGAAIDVDPDETLLTAEVIDGQIFLRGTVATEAQRAELITAAGVRINPANVIDELDVDPDSSVADADFDRFANLASLMVPNLISGEATLAGADLALTGVYATDDQNGALNSVSADGVAFDLTRRTDATAGDAANLEADLNALVAANPILFEVSSTTITADSAAIIDRVTALANRVGGIAIEIQGHTDTDGQVTTNQQLSEGRAAAVSAALVERGIAPDALTTAGFGGSQPIVDAAGIEDKAASRRVEFVVTVQ